MIFTCPDCDGQQIPAHPAGILVYKHATDCAVQESEDARMMADKERAIPQPLRPLGLGNFCETEFSRPATDTERLLLETQGYAVPDNLTTSVDFITSGVRNRTWPTLSPVMETAP